MSEETPPDTQAPTSNFWPGFLLGLPIYPLAIPWLLSLLPESVSLIYHRIYGEYVLFVWQLVGEPPF